MRRVLAACAFVAGYAVTVTVLTDLLLQERAVHGLGAAVGFFGMMAGTVALCLSLAPTPEQ